MAGRFENLSDFQKNMALIGISLLLTGLAVATHNFMVPDEPMNVGYVEVDTNCLGFDAGMCIGLQRQSHTTYNYDNYQKPEEGSDNYYRMVESELMARAYNVCNREMEGYEWTSKVSYKGKNAEEWRQNPNVQLLPCEQTFYRKLDQN